MKLFAHARFREDNGEFVTSELADDLAPTMRLWLDGAKLRPANPFEIEVAESKVNSSMATRQVAQDLTKALCILIDSGLTPRQREALKEHVPNLTVREGR